MGNFVWGWGCQKNLIYSVSVGFCPNWNWPWISVEIFSINFPHFDSVKMSFHRWLVIVGICALLTQEKHRGLEPVIRISNCQGDGLLESTEGDSPSVFGGHLMCLLCLVIYIWECFSLGLTMGGDHSQNDRWIWQLPPSSITCILGIYPTRYSHVMFMLEHGNGKLQQHQHICTWQKCVVLKMKM
jgi:hypothetical protein